MKFSPPEIKHRPGIFFLYRDLVHGRTRFANLTGMCNVYRAMDQRVNNNSRYFGNGHISLSTISSSLSI